MTRTPEQQTEWTIGLYMAERILSNYSLAELEKLVEPLDIVMDEGKLNHLAQGFRHAVNVEIFTRDDMEGDEE